MFAMRDLRYNMDEGMHSKCEMDLRDNTDLTYVLAELDLVLSEQHTDSYFRSNFKISLSHWLILEYQVFGLRS